MEDRIKRGYALTLAMNQWLERKREEIKPDPRNLLKIKPFDFGLGNEKLSIEIDKVLYGEE